MALAKLFSQSRLVFLHFPPPVAKSVITADFASPNSTTAWAFTGEVDGTKLQGGFFCLHGIVLSKA